MAQVINSDTAIVGYSDSVLLGASKKLMLLSDFATDVNMLPGSKGDVVKIPLIEDDDDTGVNAAATPSVTGGVFNEATNNFDRSKASLKDVSVTLTSYITGHAITLAQALNFDPRWWSDQGIYRGRKVGNKVFADLAAALAAATIDENNEDIEVPDVNEFDRNFVAKEILPAVDNGLIDPSEGILMLNGVYFDALIASLTAEVYGGQEAIRNGVIPGLYGFEKIVKNTSLGVAPGYILTRAGAAYASRQDFPLDTSVFTEFHPFVHEESGINMYSIIFTNGASGNTSYSTYCSYGVSAGAPSAIQKLKLAVG